MPARRERVYGQEMTREERPARFKLGLSLWAAGMLGVVAFLFLELPVMLAQHPPRHPMTLPMWAVSVLMCVQSGFVGRGFVWLGAHVSGRVGLRAPTFEAMAKGSGLGAALVPQLLPGIAGGILAAAVPWYFTSHGFILEIHRPTILAVAVLYGGITEEIMMRWGLMTLLVWVFWRLSKQSTVLRKRRCLDWHPVERSAFRRGAYSVGAHSQWTGDGSDGRRPHCRRHGFGSHHGLPFYRWGLEAAMMSTGYRMCSPTPLTRRHERSVAGDERCVNSRRLGGARL